MVKLLMSFYELNSGKSRLAARTSASGSRQP
ncbi:MAG: hypothetical protein SOH75_02935 [Lactobacillus delbrueckii]